MPSATCRISSPTGLASCVALTLAMFLAGSGGASAQQSGQPAEQPPTLPVQPGNPQTTIPEKVDPPLQKPGDTTGSTTLSDQLENSKGVIRPPAGVDPQMHVPAPDVGRMPVIPPPGTPGGKTEVQPK